jgi:hypothetical protein
LKAGRIRPAIRCHKLPQPNCQRSNEKSAPPHKWNVLILLPVGRGRVLGATQSFRPIEPNASRENAISGYPEARTQPAASQTQRAAGQNRVPQAKRQTYQFVPTVSNNNSKMPANRQGAAAANSPHAAKVAGIAARTRHFSSARTARSLSLCHASARGRVANLDSSR